MGAAMFTAAPTKIRAVARCATRARVGRAPGPSRMRQVKGLGADLQATRPGVRAHLFSRRKAVEEEEEEEEYYEEEEAPTQSIFARMFAPKQEEEYYEEEEEEEEEELPPRGLFGSFKKREAPAPPPAKVAPARSGRGRAAKNAAASSSSAFAGDNSSARQLLGVRGGTDEETDLWKIRVQLTKPVTWVPLIWGVLCGAAASGNFHWNPNDVAKALLCMTMSGPLLTGYTQTINDWYDREIDAINEPNRPIPSGKISESEVIQQIWVLLLGGIAVSAVLDVWSEHETPVIFLLTIFGSFISYIYSAPPLKLKQNGWAGNYALGSSYITLPWLAGQACFGEFDWQIVVLTMLYSIGGLGIAIVNDFKSIEGDRALGLQSLPVAFGLDTAKYLCVGSIDLTQLGIAAYLYSIGEKPYALVLLAFIIPQIYGQVKFLLPDPINNDVKYQAVAQPFFVFGLLCAGLAVGHHNSPLTGGFGAGVWN